MNHRKLALVGALSFILPGHDAPPQKQEPTPTALRRRDDAPPQKLPPKNTAPDEAASYFSALSGAMNPRFSLYEEKNPVIVVAEADKGDHKAEVIKVIESAYGKENPPRIVYLDTNLLDEEAAFTFDDLLRRQGVSPSSVRAVNYSMASWFDSSTPSSAMAMRRNIGNFRDTIFVHGAGNSEGAQPVYGLTTQSDHALVVGATLHAAHEKPHKDIRETHFTASSTSRSSAVDLVMRGQDVPIGGVSGRWSKDGKSDESLRHITGTSFAAPQVTALSAKISARLRSLYLKGLPGRRFSDELSYENIRAKDQRQQSFADMVTASIMASADPIHPGDASAVVATAHKRPFDTMGSGFGMPDFALAERTAFDQMMAAQLSGRIIPTTQYQSYAPENTQVFPRARFENAAAERAASGRNPLRHTASVYVPLPLKSRPVEGEKDTVAIDIPPFETNMTAQLVRGSLLCKVAGKGKKIPSCELFLETPKGLRLPLGSFSPEPKEILFGDEKPHPIDDYRFVNFRTRALMMDETVPKDAKSGMRLIVKARGADPAALEFFASGDTHLPLLEITGAPRDKDMFTHHPAAASKLGFIPQSAMVESYRVAFESLEDALDNNKPAQLILEDFIEGNRVTAQRVLAELPKLTIAAGNDEEKQKALALLLHATVVEPVGRAAAERLMHLAHHYEAGKSDKLATTTAAYTGLYSDVLAYERSLVGGSYKELPQLASSIAAQVKEQAPALAAYGSLAPVLFAASPLPRRKPPPSRPSTTASPAKAFLDFRHCPRAPSSPADPA